MIKYSFIIPYKNHNLYIDENLNALTRLKSSVWEVILLPDFDYKIRFNIPPNQLKMFGTGPVSPGVKRDIGAQQAEGEYLIFLDDDSYPSEDYLEVLKNYTQVNAVEAIGGPAITPQSDDFWQKTSGAVFASKYTGGNPERYFSVGEIRYVNDWPSVNLVVRRDIFKLVGGFGNKYWPGEDTFFCNNLQNKGFKIVYLPNLIVFHHRRKSLREHLKQIGNYGYHRGYFAKKYPENSRKIKYFLPAILVLTILLFLIFYFLKVNYIIEVLQIILLMYFFLIPFFNLVVLRYYNPLIYFASLPYIYLTHFFYGLRFIMGFSQKTLTSALRQ